MNAEDRKELAICLNEISTHLGLPQLSREWLTRMLDYWGEKTVPVSQIKRCYWAVADESVSNKMPSPKEVLEKLNPKISYRTEAIAALTAILEAVRLGPKLEREKRIEMIGDVAWDYIFRGIGWQNLCEQKNLHDPNEYAQMRDALEAAFEIAANEKNKRIILGELESENEYQSIQPSEILQNLSVNIKTIDH